MITKIYFVQGNKNMKQGFWLILIIGFLAIIIGAFDHAIETYRVGEYFKDLYGNNIRTIAMGGDYYIIHDGLTDVYTIDEARRLIK